MARPPRLEFEGAVYHLTSRGDRRDLIFRDDHDRSVFLRKLGREVHQQRWICHAYCLMGNHYHLLVETPEANLVNGMRRLNGSYTQTFNRRHDTVGHVFQGRYKSILVEKERHLLELCRYIALNPVRARFCKEPGGWEWSSFNATAGLGPEPDWLTTIWILGHFSQNADEARSRYMEFVARGMQSGNPWENLRGQVFLGGEDFLRRSQALLNNRPVEGIPLSQLTPARPTKEVVLGRVAAAYGLPVDRVFNRCCYGAYIAGIYLLRRVVNMPLKEVAALAKVSAPRVSQIQRRVEEGFYSKDPVLRKLLWDYKVKA